MFWSLLALLIIIISYYILDWIIRSMRIGKANEKYILITGCDSGFGRALAIHLDSVGFHVFAGCLTENGAKFLSEKCSSNVATFLLDVTDAESIQHALHFVKLRLPQEKGLWGLVNNAGVVGTLGAIELYSAQDYKQVINVNLLGPVEMVRNFLPLIRKSQGRIVNVSSMCGRFPTGVTPYSCSKFGVEAFSDILRREVYNQNIKVSIIEPGGFRTGLADVDVMIEATRKCFERASPDVQSHYGEDFIAKKKEVLSNMSKECNPDLQPVVDAMTHALTARFPRTRYVVGNFAKYFYIPLSYLPDWLSDWVVKATDME
ncbi:17-beta-hydroxysteroid dehydrogenase type 6-like [Physella acuta]|uniref:17-beta-hydroxysteroid dehydrogenase type 6-like n=1 Tax=Physella acuta TaxID=109671 RepID=UPI0027DD5209|nr:17-beta-hydroxysteroid dehydrogenase type 6-like [Physella acuta]